MLPNPLLLRPISFRFINPKPSVRPLSPFGFLPNCICPVFPFFWGTPPRFVPRGGIRCLSPFVLVRPVSQCRVLRSLLFVILFARLCGPKGWMSLLQLVRTCAQPFSSCAPLFRPCGSTWVLSALVDPNFCDTRPFHNLPPPSRDSFLSLKDSLHSSPWIVKSLPMENRYASHPFFLHFPFQNIFRVNTSFFFPPRERFPPASAPSQHQFQPVPQYQRLSLPHFPYYAWSFSILPFNLLRPLPILPPVFFLGDHPNLRS